MSELSLDPKLLSVGELFGEGEVHYEIPIYQRNYAWGVEQIEQLIEDIDVAARENAENYFLGNLVVARKETAPGSSVVTYEVVDGQQRLTTLYMLLSYLDVNELNAALTYQSRRAATDALAGLKTTEADAGSGIQTGFKIIESRMAIVDKARFRDVLVDKVHVVRAVLPRRTDLNRYFEVMNTRGQQLQQVDIVKARLMRHLDAEDQACFAWIWDACADMDRYVQMSLTPGNTELRKQIFDDDWDRLSIRRFEDLRKWHNASGTAAAVSGNGLSLRAAVVHYASLPADEDGQGAESERFESPIRFPSLLLHALKVMRSEADGRDEDGQLDDSKLIKLFSAEFDSVGDTDRSARVRQFAETLLRCKFVLDNFLLKREFTATNADDGAWSLKRLARARDRQTAGFPTAFAPGADETDGPRPDDATRRVLLLQSMLRITYTSPRTMHWITTVLRLPVLDQTRSEAAESIGRALRSFARRRVRQAFFDGAEPTGFAIERIVFTYLDYLLAERDGRDFTFVYRNSIEHFFPQHPDQEQVGWDGLAPGAPELDLLGNLALVSIGANSKFSNNLPRNKVSFAETIQQSAKLQVMADQVRAGTTWDGAAISEHHAEMVALLNEDLRKDPPGGSIDLVALPPAGSSG